MVPDWVAWQWAPLAGVYGDRRRAGKRCGGGAGEKRRKETGGCRDFNGRLV